MIRLILYADDFSQAGNYMAAGQALDYAEVAIDSKHFLLPSRSTAYVRIGPYESREEIAYRNYRKFSSEAAINFTDDARG